MSTLPLHSPTSPDDADAWGTLPPPAYAAQPSKHRTRGFRPLIRLKLVRATPRTALLLTCGALVCLWFFSSQLLGPGGPGGIMRGPGPPPPGGGPPPPFEGPLGGHHPPPPPPHGRPGSEFGGGKEEPGANRPPSSGSGSDSSASVNWAERAERVKEAFVHAYHGYEEHAFPKDELLPLSNGSVNNFNGWGVSMVDALDTMYLMGLHDEFERGIKLVEKMSFSGENATTVPFFETVIRYLGGLLSAYGLSHDASLLARADELGAALLPAFNTTSGFPMFAVHTRTGETAGGWAGYRTAWLAEVASCTMEYKYLAKLTGRKEYWDAAEGVMRRIYDANMTRFEGVGGLLPTLWTISDGQPANDQVSIGALSDSAYEYFLKQYLLTNQTDTASRDLYLRTMKGALSHLLYLSPSRSLLYVTDIRASGNAPVFPSRKFEHLSCFFPGLLALGAARLPEDDFTPYGGADERQRHLWAAEGLAVSCGTMYSDMPTGLGADEVVFTSRWEQEWQRANQERQKEVTRLKEEADRLAKEWEKAEGEEGAYGAETLTPPTTTDGWVEETTVLPETRTVLKRDQHGEVYATGRDLIDGLEPGRQANKKPAPNQVAKPKAKYPQVKYPPPVQLKMNQTAEDEKLRWTNVLEAWRRGRYDGERNVWLDEDGKDVPPGYVESTTVEKGEFFQGGKGAGGAHGGEVGHGGEAGHGGPEEHIGAVEEMKVIGPPKGPVPGLRDPPPEAPPATNLRDYRSQNGGYYLRPETIESFFIMWRTTGDVVWRERGWAAFLALERESRTPSGYAALRNVFFSTATGTDTSIPSGNNGFKSNWSTNQLDSMPSYFLAETLKYLYLLFSDEDLLPLDKYVLNTEAHPFPVFEWTDWEREKFGISS